MANDAYCYIQQSPTSLYSLTWSHIDITDFE